MYVYMFEFNGRALQISSHTYPSPTCSVPAHAIHESGLPVNARPSRYYDGDDDDNNNNNNNDIVTIIVE